MKQFIQVGDVSDIQALIHKGLEYKQDPFMDKMLGAGKRVGLLFLNPSLRTRLSTQVAAQNLGMDAVVFNVDKEGWALEFAEGAIMNGTTVEHVKDAAPILGQYFDILCIRTFPALQNRDEDYAETIINQFIKYAGVPVVSLESATLHPLQSLTDLITIQESIAASQLIKKPKVVLTWAPHVKALPQAVPNSFAEWMRKAQEESLIDFVITHPEGYELAEEFTKGITITHQQEEALAEADFIYVKNWSSYQDYGKMLPVNGEWMLTKESLSNAPHVQVMHCLPVRRDLELAADILDSDLSLVIAEAGNRVWAAQAVLKRILSA